MLYAKVEETPRRCIPKWECRNGEKYNFYIWSWLPNFKTVILSWLEAFDSNSVSLLEFSSKFISITLSNSWDIKIKEIIENVRPKGIFRMVENTYKIEYSIIEELLPYN